MIRLIRTRNNYEIDGVWRLLMFGVSVS